MLGTKFPIYPDPIRELCSLYRSKIEKYCTKNFIEIILEISLKMGARPDISGDYGCAELLREIFFNCGKKIFSSKRS